MAWQFTLAGLDGVPLGDISDASERKVSFLHNRPQTAEATLKLTHPAAPDVLNEGHFFVFVYRDGTLRMVAETVSLQTIGDDQGNHSIKIVAQEAAWPRLAKRYLGQGSAGVQTSGPTERGALAQFLLLGLNGESYTGVEIGTWETTQLVSVGPWYYKPYTEALLELSADLYGFDFYFEPVLPTAANDYRVGTLHLPALRGDERPDAVFEYGDGRHNARSYDWMIDVQHRITHAISLPPTYPNNLGLDAKHAFSTVTETALPGLKRRSDIVQNDLVDATMRQQLIEEHVDVRKNPRNIFIVQPHLADGTGRVPEPFTDYDIGDRITGRVKDSGVLLLDGLVRIYGIEVTLDDQGTETIDLTLVDEG